MKLIFRIQGETEESDLDIITERAALPRVDDTFWLKVDENIPRSELVRLTPPEGRDSKPYRVTFIYDSLLICRGEHGAYRGEVNPEFSIPVVYLEEDDRHE